MISYYFRIKGVFLTICWGALLANCSSGILFAETLQSKTPDLGVSALADLSLEELSQVKVTSAGKREQTLNSTASAIFVISQKDIQKSTATTIPGLLRMVPGLQVAQVDSHTWSITARGFGGVFANKLLVLMDGRTVYSPLYSGTYWDVQDYPLEDTERIEVIRGPGGTLWGSNAVNGVINIITKKTKDTVGGMTSVTTGNENHAIGSVRYGAATESSAGRVYARGRVVDSSVRDAGGSADDQYTSGQTGFKVESALSDKTHLTAQGDLYSLNLSDTLSLPQVSSPYSSEQNQWSHSRGGNLLTRLETEGFGEKDKASVQFFFDRATRSEQVARTGVNTWDLDTQYDYNGFKNHTLIFGSGVRTINDSIGERKLVTVSNDGRNYSLVNGFIQDEYAVIPDQLTVTTGIKFEHNEFTGPTWQPSFKTNWRATESLSFWGSISRATRIPSRVSNDIRLPVAVLPPSDQNPLPTLLQITGSAAAKPEIVTSYETGIRAALIEGVSLDSTAYFADYSRLDTYNTGIPQLSSFQGSPVILQSFDNGASGKAYSVGVENLIEITPSTSSRIQFWHSFQFVNTRSIGGQREIFLAAEEHRNPTTQLGARGQFDLPGNFEFNPMVRFVDSLSAVDVRSYWEVDLQLAYKADKNLRFSLNLANALRDQHLEYRSDYVTRPTSKIERSLFLNVNYQF